MKLRIKYCGGCNPIINRSKLVAAVRNELSKSVDVEVVDQDADVGLLVSGCQVCCPNLSQIEDQARQWVIVGGDRGSSAGLHRQDLVSEARKLRMRISNPMQKNGKRIMFSQN